MLLHGYKSNTIRGTDHNEVLPALVWWILARNTTTSALTAITFSIFLIFLNPPVPVPSHIITYLQGLSHHMSDLLSDDE